MRKPFLIAMALAIAPFAAQAEVWNIYGWQNHSWEFVDEDGGRSYDRVSSNAGNIGFMASVDTGMDGIMVNLRCEQFTYFNHNAGRTSWCNRNSKIGLSHPMMGEIMFATWLLPYNEGVAQWVDPFYDAGSDSHTSIMGSVGANTIFYNTGEFGTFDYTTAGAYDTGFNRRQEHIIQYWSPNWNGFVFRFAWTAGNRDETAAPVGGGDIDPVIRSSSLAYTNGPLWLAVTWQDHEDWTAASIGNMNSSDAESFRVAGRYIMDLGDGMSVQIPAMWEDLEYEFNGVTSVDAAMAAFGYSDEARGFAKTGNLTADTPADPFMRRAFEGTPFSFMPEDNEDHEMRLLQEKTLGLLHRKITDDSGDAPLVYSYTEGDDVSYGMAASDGNSDTTDAQVMLPAYVAPGGGDTIQEADDTAGNGSMNIYSVDDNGDPTANATALNAYLQAWGVVVMGLEGQSTRTEAEDAYIKTYSDLVAEATR